MNGELNDIHMNLALLGRKFIDRRFIDRKFII